MSKIKWIDVEGERVALKGGKNNWRVVAPIKDESGKLNWFNLLTGGKRNLITLIIFLLVVTFALWSYNHDIKEIQASYQAIANDPIGWCKDVNSGSVNPFAYSNISAKLNISELQK